MRIFFSSAEVSSDIHAAEVIRALKELVPDVEVFGVGGPHSEAAGLEIILPSQKMLAMGFTEAVGRLPTLWKAKRQILAVIEERKPDLCVLLDYPEFHMRLARTLRKRSLRVIDFIPPKIWVWRKHRLLKLRAYFEKVLCILPFEAEIYSASGVPAIYVGNPLLDRIPFDLTQQEAKKRLGLGERTRYFSAWVGSRLDEVRRHLPVVLGAFEQCIFLKKMDAALILQAAGEQQLQWIERGLKEWRQQSEGRDQLKISIVREDPYLVMKASDFAWIKSGTSTLEAALVGVPHCVFYATSRFTLWLFKHVIRYRGPVGLGNLILKGTSPAPHPIREWIGLEATEKNLADTAQQYLQDPHACIEFQRQVDQVRSSMHFQESPAQRAAQEILKTLYTAPLAELHHPLHGFRPWLFVTSVVWSTLNAIVRRVRKPVSLGIPTVSIGNLQVGGAGKTPLAVEIARRLLSQNARVVILSRGYGRKNTEIQVIHGEQGSKSVSLTPENFGDEPILLHQLVPEAWIAVGSDRISAYRAAVQFFGRDFDVAILEDGLQSFRVARNWDLVCMTDHRPWNFIFRDWKKVLNQSNTLVVWMKGGDLPVDPNLTVVRFVENEPCLPEHWRQEKFWLVLGVADPGQVEEQLRRQRLNIERVWRFKDHARYDQDWVQQFIGRAREQKVKIALTGKDWVKWQEFIKDTTLKESLIWVLEPSLVCVSGEEHLQKVLLSLLPGASTSSQMKRE